MNELDPSEHMLKQKPAHDIWTAYVVLAGEYIDTGQQPLRKPELDDGVVDIEPLATEPGGNTLINITIEARPSLCVLILPTGSGHLSKLVDWR
ncbi:hypothetical protein [Spiribacter roseus]|uniref:Uncharacterized protein n=1 Tax=Spiribacter roseus TaxID=1855875 RepID=A0ABV3RXW5_9GAMM